MKILICMNKQLQDNKEKVGMPSVPTGRKSPMQSHATLCWDLCCSAKS